MPALRKALVAEGFDDVRTYVQSGNLVVRSTHSSPGRVARQVAALVSKEFGVDAPVVVRTAQELERVLGRNPFPEAALERPNLLHVVFLAGTPGADKVADLHGHELARDSCLVDGDHLYVDYRHGVHSSKLTPAFLARVLQVEGTARNWRTVKALEKLTR